MQQWWKWFEEGTSNALHYFEKAIESEPDYAPAHAGAALTHIFASTFVGLCSPSNGVPQGKAAAEKPSNWIPRLPSPMLRWASPE